jgi:hypothetical protein
MTRLLGLRDSGVYVTEAAVRWYLEILPAALAHLEQKIDDRTRAAVQQLRSDLRKALTK